MENEQVEKMKAPKVPSGTEMTKNIWGPEGPYGTPLRGVTLDPVGPLTLSNSECPMGPTSRVIGSFIGMGSVGFWFGIGFMPAVETEQSGRTYKKIAKWKKKINNMCNKNHNK